jgi:acetyl esterase/lipase
MSPGGVFVGNGRSPQERWASLSQAERDEAYDNNKAVANSAELIAARNTASAAYRAAHSGHLDIAYGPEERQKIDLYPAGNQTAPCFIFIHGGYWQRNSREFFSHIGSGAAALGWSVAMPSYRLAPQATLTEIVADIGLMLDWLAAHGPEHGIDGPVILSGWSAGAQLAVMHLDHKSVVGGLALSGVYDLAPLRDTFLNAALKLTDAEIETLSPLKLPPATKPLVVAYGAAELPALVADSQALHDVRAAANAPSALIPIEGADHFTVLDELLQADGKLLSLVRMMVG